MKQKYAWSRNSDDEIWHGGPCDSIKECVEEALAEGYSMEESFALGYIEPYEINYDFADIITERLAEDAYYEVGDIAYDWLDGIPLENLDKLNDRVTDVVKAWLKEIHEEPTFYKVLPCEECTLQEAIEMYNEKVDNMSRGGKIDD